jgi:hypothetical protein
MRTIKKEYKLIETSNYLKIHVYYDKGGMNYFSGNVEKRGIYISVTPVTKNKSECGTYSSEQMTAFTGTKMLIEEKARWSKSLESYEVPKENLDALINHVCNQNNIQLHNTPFGYSVKTGGLQNTGTKLNKL